MWFKKKKDVDLRDLHRKGLIKMPKKETEVETDRDGFVDLGSSNQQTTMNDNLSQTGSNSSFFSTFDTPQVDSSNQPSQNTDRELTRKLEELDNKIYKLEQRIELLERKSGVGNNSGYSWQ